MWNDLNILIICIYMFWYKKKMLLKYWILLIYVWIVLIISNEIWGIILMFLKCLYSNREIKVNLDLKFLWIIFGYFFVVNFCRVKFLFL